jgi:hypothetical protein
MQIHVYGCVTVLLHSFQSNSRHVILLNTGATAVPVNSDRQNQLVERKRIRWTTGLSRAGWIGGEGTTSCKHRKGTTRYLTNLIN